MFSQVDRSIERSQGGLGIGLALVKGLVEMHGGTVTAESAGPGQGSTFTVSLPTSERAAASPITGPASDEQRSRAGRHSWTGTTSSGRSRAKSVGRWRFMVRMAQNAGAGTCHHVPAPRACRRPNQCGVVSLTVLSGVLPLSCTAVIALSIAGVLAGLG